MTGSPTTFPQESESISLPGPSNWESRSPTPRPRLQLRSKNWVVDMVTLEFGFLVFGTLHVWEGFILCGLRTV